MAKGKISAKVKGAINTGITLQADDKWCKNSPVAKKFATRVFFNRKWKNAGDLIEANLQRLLSICKKILFIGWGGEKSRARFWRIWRTAFSINNDSSRIRQFDFSVGLNLIAVTGAGIVINFG